MDTKRGQNYFMNIYIYFFFKKRKTLWKYVNAIFAFVFTSPSSQRVCAPFICLPVETRSQATVCQADI